MICHNCENTISDDVVERCPTCGIRIVDLTQDESILFRIRARDKRFSGVAEFIARPNSVATINGIKADSIMQLTFGVALEPSENGNLYTLRHQGVESETDGQD